MKRLTSWISVLLLLGCAPKPPAEVVPTPTNPEPPTAAAPAETLTVAVVPKAVSQQFWTTIKSGAEAAGKELGAEVIWKGPNAETDIAGQRSIVEDFITQKVSAIVLAATDADALVETIKQAEAAGIPVITIDSGVNYDQVRSLVATDNVAGAKLAGEHLIELIGGEGDVGLIPFVQGAASSQQREDGFRQAVDAADKVRLAAVDYSKSDEGTAKNVTQDMLTSHPTLAGIFAANEAGVVGAANALREMNKAGAVKLVGFDASPAEVKLLEDGVVQALVVQDPYNMGYLGVKSAVQAAKGETVETRVDTGVTLVTKENLQTPEVQRLLNPSAAPPTG